jgi:hypothetical protein
MGLPSTVQNRSDGVDALIESLPDPRLFSSRKTAALYDGAEFGFVSAAEIDSTITAAVQKLYAGTAAHEQRKLYEGTAVHEQPLPAPRQSQLAQWLSQGAKQGPLATQTAQQSAQNQRLADLTNKPILHALTPLQDIEPSWATFGGFGGPLPEERTPNPLAVDPWESLFWSGQKPKNEIVPAFNVDPNIFIDPLGGKIKSYEEMNPEQTTKQVADLQAAAARLRDSLILGAGTTVGALVGGGPDTRSGEIAGIGAMFGQLGGAALGQGMGKLLGTVVLPGVGSILGGIAGGLIGGLFGKKKRKVEPQFVALDKIERNTRETITAIENQTSQLLSLDSRLLNVPASFVVPQFRPPTVGGGIGANNITTTISGVTINVQGATNPEATAQAVRKALTDDLRKQGRFVSVRA